MTQTASLLVVVTVFTWLMVYNAYMGLIHETKLHMQEHELKTQGGLMCEGGVIADSTVVLLE